VYFIGIEDVTGNLSINGWNMILLCNNNVVSLNGNALQNDNIMADAIVGAVRTFEPGLEDNEFILRMSSAGANPVSWTVYVDLYPSAN
jgi:hypothetical protein